MSLTADSLGITWKSALGGRNIPVGKSHVAIFMVDHTPRFKQLLDTAQLGNTDEMARKFAGFYRYAKILNTIASATQSGSIKIPNCRGFGCQPVAGESVTTISGSKGHGSF